MIELVIQSRCIECDRCVRVCPTNVFDSVPDAAPVIARQQDCQTCFLCELYCPADALYVGPDCDHPAPVDEVDIVATDWPEQYRRDAGWGKDRDQHPNDVAYMHTMAQDALSLRAGRWGRDPRPSLPNELP
jgi:NAD-dependent dihydropyrimidine dehydrogenase PreA subunit